MTLLLRQAARVENARSFYRDIYNENDFFYVFASRARAWEDDTTPETPRDSQYYQAQYRHDMLFVKRIQASDVVTLAPRYDWETGTVYDQYDDEYAPGHPAFSGATNLADAKFYVITDEFNVYKCLDNNNNSQSTIKPTSTATDTFELDDGYIWKFMFQVGSADRTKFLNDDFIPVRKVAGAGNPAFDVNGELDSIAVTAGGSGYTSAPTVVIEGDGTGAVATATLTGDVVTSITVTSEGRGYSFAFVKITGGGGSGATATASLGSTETPSLQSAVEAAAVSGTLDRIVVTSGGVDFVEGDIVINVKGDGNNATASASVNEAGTITDIQVTDPGQGYTFVELEIQQTVGNGTGASLRPVVSPVSGHGGNPPRELFAKNVGVTVSFTSDDADVIVGNEFRQVGFIKNMHTYDESGTFTSAVGTPCHVVTIDTADASKFNLDDKVTTDDGGEFSVIQKIDASGDGNIDTVYLLEKFPGISASSTFTNVTTGDTGITINTVTDPEISNHSGEILYIDNRRPITRDENQVETLKVVFNF
jgi:hypothetical protein